MKHYTVLVIAGLAAIALGTAKVNAAQRIVSSTGYNGGNWSHYHHHHFHHGGSDVFFDVGFGYPFGFGYPYGFGYYPYGSYPYGYGYGYGSDYYGAPVRGEMVNGSYGSVVARVQQRLARAGYYHGAIDGVAGSGTHRAIRAYERAHGLPVDGEIDRQLLATMGLA